MRLEITFSPKVGVKGCGVNDKSAHDALKKINAQRNAVGVGGYKDSRRQKCEQHEKFNTAINEMNVISDKQKIKELDNE